MFSVYISGQRDRQDADMVKLTMIFYRTGCCRAEKVLYISGLYADWDAKSKRFKSDSMDNKAKNRLIQAERIKYLNVAEHWEYSGKRWSPKELSHYFNSKEKAADRYISVAGMFDIKIKEYTER